MSLKMNNIAVFGASGRTASEVIFQALRDGDSIVGLTRHPENLTIPKGGGGEKAGQPISDPKLVMISGDATKREDVNKVFTGSKIDGVIVALGGKTAKVGNTMLGDSAQNIVDAMEDNGVKRIAVVSSLGVGDSYKIAPWWFKGAIRIAMRTCFKDKDRQDEIVRTSGLEYCIVRPADLKEEPATGVINVIEGKAGEIPRADVAKFCLDAIRQADFPYIHKTPCLSSVKGTVY
eukprot:Nitzschia sp. Nitz4//scaffold4_size323378//7929//8627//NITZ4_000605-RA/size323378-processed-gene-0.153-mRNA-1//-1//CDS//3329553234//5783//frame0